MPFCGSSLGCHICLRTCHRFLDFPSGHHGRHGTTVKSASKGKSVTCGACLLGPSPARCARAGWSWHEQTSTGAGIYLGGPGSPLGGTAGLGAGRAPRVLMHTGMSLYVALGRDVGLIGGGVQGSRTEAIAMGMLSPILC